MSTILGIFAGLLLLVSGTFILIQVKKGLSTPNLTTWLINLCVGTINAFTFYEVVNSNIYQSLIMFMSLFTLIVIFFYTMSKGKFAKLNQLDIILFILAIFVGVVWKLTDDRLANLLVQIVIFIANSATIIGLWQKKLREYYVSWIFAVSAYIVAITSIMLSSNQDWLAYFGPILNGVIGNGLVLILSSKTKK
ncbi:MAG: hypothetical protein WAZ12_01875 [Candidatus Absconditicoccaceae bacterium]